MFFVIHCLGMHIYATNSIVIGMLNHDHLKSKTSSLKALWNCRYKKKLI